MDIKRPMQMHTNTSSFVDSRVRTNEISRRLIASICPYFPTSAKVISAHLPLSELYWKINFHWDVARQATTYLQTLDPNPKQAETLKAVLSTLDSCKPNPNRGYYQGGRETIGLPVDVSPSSLVEDRPRIVRRAKQLLKSLLAAEKFKEPIRKQGMVNLAIAPVSAPNKSNHIYGWALDIQGDNKEIHKIANELGASYTTDELNHVHCEWQSGVRIPRKQAALPPGVRR